VVVVVVVVVGSCRGRGRGSDRGLVVLRSIGGAGVKEQDEYCYWWCGVVLVVVW
jgi:hypothetical protein